jgi:hypothetical protein
VARGKQAVRDWMRQQPDGETRWIELQGHVYGSLIERAVPTAGLAEFLNDCRQHGIELSIISHKTLYPHLGPQVSLHEAARGWLERQRMPIPRERWFFETSLQGKLQRIAACTHFVDDLEEVLVHADFPASVKKIHYGVGTPHHGLVHCHTWKEVSAHLFGAA